jgi:transcriptional regulator with XRE-family HTH domain
LNRITAGRLYAIAQALGVEVGYFFEGVQTAARFESSPEQRMLIDLARDYLKVPVPEHRAAIATLARARAEENAKSSGA